MSFISKDNLQRYHNGIKGKIADVQEALDELENKAVVTEAQTLTEAQKAQVRENIGADANTVKYTAQTLTDAQKAQARDNINAAAPDGYYGTSGGVMQYSTNFLGKNSPQNASNVVFRPTASNFSGSGWSADSISGQTATIEKIKGKTLVFNQAITQEKIDAFDGKVGNFGITYSVVNNKILFSGTIERDSADVVMKISTIAGHKYYCGKLVNTKNGTFLINGPVILYANGEMIYTATKTVENENWFFTTSASSIGKEVDGYWEPAFIDLTKMYGQGREPATGAEFKAQFPLDYYQYNTGELISLNATGLKTNGFNLLNVNRTAGTITSGTGDTEKRPEILDETKYFKGLAYNNYANDNNTTAVTVTDNSVKMTSNNIYGVGFPFKCLPNMTYRVQATKSSAGYIGLMGYDDEGNYLSSLATDAGTYIEYTTPSNCHWLVALFTGNNNTVTFTNPVVHLKWSGVRDGDYEAYWDSTLSLPIADYFADGMKSAGTVYDELTKDKAIKRFGKVDLGSLDWVPSAVGSGDRRFFCIKSDIIPTVQSTKVANIICDKYTAISNQEQYSGIEGICIHQTDKNIFVYDKKYISYSSTDFKTAMSGVILYYELETPVETPISPELNLTYRCDDFGTEMLLPQNDDEPVTAPMDCDITYQLDYEADVRNMGQNMISKESMDGFISAFNGSGLGTITQTWDATNKKYTYTVTPPAPAE